ncbi:hypothetical protein [Streptomyces mirabilis]|uniref:hypothetical protein n=1 Tax=Streptomyces mirabilis TaxID=68239 RepID=UPI0037FA7676
MQIAESNLSFHPDLAFWITVALAGLGIWLTWKFSERDTRLYYELTRTTGLMSAQARQAGLTVQHNGRSLDDPYVTTLTISVSSRRAIEEGRLGGRALDFGLGATIFSEVEAHYLLGNKPGSEVEWPTYGTEGSKLTLGPAHLHNDAEFIATLLLDGPPRLAQVPRTVANVKPVRGLRRPIQEAVFSLRLVARFLEAGLLFLAAGLLLNDNTGYGCDGPQLVGAALLIAGTLLLVLTGTFAVGQLPTRRGSTSLGRLSPARNLRDIPEESTSDALVRQGSPPVAPPPPRGLRIRRPLVQQRSARQRRMLSHQSK